MRRELKKAITRIRKAQDAVVNKQLDGVRAIGVDAHHYIHPNYESAYFSITIHKNLHECKVFDLGMLDGEDINDTLNRISEYINHEI